MDAPSKQKGALPSRLSQKLSANLDILRSAAVLLVLLCHCLGIVADRHHLQGLDGNIRCLGRLGVLLFFVHTSLVLNFSLARIGASGWALFHTFIVRRVFRLYPLSILCVLLVVAFKVPNTLLAQHVGYYDWAAVFSNITLTTGFTGFPVVLDPLWTLPVELQMYVAMPFIFMLLGPTRSPRVALALWLLAAAIAWLRPDLADYVKSVKFAPCFMAGTAAYTLSGLYRRRIAAFLWIPFLLALLYGTVAIPRTLPYDIFNMPLAWMFCLLLGLTIPLFHDSRSAIVNYVANRISRYSYGIYLFHHIALWVGCVVLSRFAEPLQWLATLVLLGVMSIGGYHLLEKPAIDLGVQLTARSRPIWEPRTRQSAG